MGTTGIGTGFFDTIIRLSILDSILHYNESTPELEMDVF